MTIPGTMTMRSPLTSHPFQVYQTRPMKTTRPNSQWTAPPSPILDRPTHPSCSSTVATAWFVPFFTRPAVESWRSWKNTTASAIPPVNLSKTLFPTTTRRRTTTWCTPTTTKRLGWKSWAARPTPPNARRRKILPTTEKSHGSIRLQRNEVFAMAHGHGIVDARRIFPQRIKAALGLVCPAHRGIRSAVRLTHE
jgi:hypothetical protein